MSSQVGVLQGIVSGLGLGEALIQGQALREQAEFESSALKANARLARLEARDALQRGAVEAQEHDLEVMGLIGRQRAAIAAQGLDLDSGTALQLQQDAYRQGREDSLRIRAGAWREAFGKRSEAGRYMAAAGFARTAARARAGGLILTAGLEGARDALRYYAPKPRERVLPAQPYVPDPAKLLSQVYP